MQKKKLAQTSDETERTKLVQIIQQVDQYLTANKTTYETWKEGGIGRALLQSGVGGVMTGNASGALAGGSTSLAAPHLNEAEEKLGSTGTLINALGGAAIGYATGGSGGAVVGANVDWHNRQLHPSEYKLAEQYADIVASRLKISREEALGRIIRHMQRTVDYATAKADNFRTDDAIISILGANNLPKQDQHYTNPNYNKQYIQNYVRDFNLANKYNYFGKTPTQSRDYKVGVVTDIGKAALNSGIGIFESAANLATGEIDPNSWAYVHMGRIRYTHPEYGNALENTMTLGVAAVTAGRGVKSGNKATTEKTVQVTTPVTSNGTANIATYPKLKSDLVQQNWDNIAKQDSRLNSAVNDWKNMQPNGKGEINFGIGSASHSEAERLGRIWVGDGARLVNNPSCKGCLISADGTRLYRPPTTKKNTPTHLNPTGTQANFVIRDPNTRTTLTIPTMR